MKNSCLQVHENEHELTQYEDARERNIELEHTEGQPALNRADLRTRGMMPAHYETLLCDN